MIVENIIPRNVIINGGTAEVDNHISRDDILTIIQSGNVIFILLYQTLDPLFSTILGLPLRGEFLRENNAQPLIDSMLTIYISA